MKRFLLGAAILGTLHISAQNVGIGTNTPAYKLDVVGDVNVNSGSGFKVNGSAAAGQYLRGDGARFIPDLIKTADVPSGSAYYIWNGTVLQTGDFRISGNGSVGTLSIGAAAPSASAALDIAATNKGVSFPNVDLQSNSDGTTIVNPKKGLVVYNTGVTLSPSGLYINTGSAVTPNWQKLSDASGTIGSITVSAPLTSTGGANPTLGLGVVGITNGGTGSSTPPVAGQLLIGNGSGTYSLNTLTGTANQVNVNNGSGTITLSAPQDIHTGASPTFNDLTLSSNNVAGGMVYTTNTGNLNTTAAGTSGQILKSNGAAAPQWDDAANVLGNGYVKNQVTQQASANFNIDGSGVTGTSLAVGTNTASTTKLYVKGNGVSPIIDAVDNGNNSKLYVAAAGNVGVNTNAPSVGLDVRTSDGVKLPAGSTANRPASPLAGTTRFNTDNSTLEYYDGTQWVSANTTQVPIGTVTPYAGTTAPSGWLICDGSPVSRTTYNLLFAIIGTTYGPGDGSTTFNLPDLRGKTAFGMGTSAPYNSLGATGGAISVTPVLSPSLSVDIAAFNATLPNHVHSVPAHSHGFTLSTGANTTGNESGHTHTWGGNWSTDNAATVSPPYGDGTQNTYSDGVAGIYSWNNYIGTTTNGSHTHNLRHSGELDETQGWPAGGFNAVWSTDRTGGSQSSAPMIANGDHSHSVYLPNHRHWIQSRATSAGSAHNHSIPAMSVTGSIGTAGTSGDAAFNSGNPTTNPSIAVDPPSTVVTGTVTTGAISTNDPFQVVNYIIKVSNTASSTIVAANVPTGTFGQTLYFNSGWTPTSNVYNDGSKLGVGTTSPAPTALLSVGSGNPFQVNNSGNIAAATGITSSGTITFSGLNTNGLVRTTGTNGVLSIGQAATGDIANGAITDAKVTDVAWGKITGKPTTLAGYGITDAAPISGSGNYIQNQTSADQAAGFRINGRANIGNGTTFAVPNGYMASGSLTIGGTNVNYGGGSGWTGNTAGLLLETSANTEIGIHDGGTRVASAMYYEGDGVNRITIGRDMGWGALGTLALNGNVGIGAASPAVSLAVGGNGTNVYSTSIWAENNIHVQGNETLAQGGRGRLRVGTAWGYMGLYAESSSTGVANDLILGTGSGLVRVGPPAGNHNLRVSALEGSGNRPVFADANGQLKAGSKNMVSVVDRNARYFSNANVGFVSISNTSGNLTVETGDQIVVNSTLKFRFNSGSGDDNVIFRISVTGCSTFAQQDSYYFEDFDNNRAEFEPVAVQYAFTSPCSGNLQFTMQMDHNTSADDDAYSADVVVVATRY